MPKGGKVNKASKGKAVTSGKAAQVTKFKSGKSLKTGRAPKGKK